MSIHQLNSMVHHDGSFNYVIKNTNRLQINDAVEIRVRGSIAAPIQKIFLRTFPNGEEYFQEMTIAYEDDICRWWKTNLVLTMPVNHYRFLIVTDQDFIWLNSRGVTRSLPTDHEDYKILAGYLAPEWVKDCVFYQIFPDRFFDGDETNNVRDHEFEYRGVFASHKSWGELPTHEWPQSGVEFFGGDLVGIKSKLDYLSDLGVNAIYLTPIFTSYSNHRYDVVDYFHVDKHLGGNQALTELVAAIHESQSKIILDIVPNHCGAAHPWFIEAQNDANAESAEFFTFYNHPDEYESWLGVRSLPKLNYKSSRLREIMYAGENSVFRTWLKNPYLIDGWRIDVANMLARQGPDQLAWKIGKEIREAVKQENSEAYLLGENFFDASSQLQGNFLDAVMNYAGFNRPLANWLIGEIMYIDRNPQPVINPNPYPTSALVDTWRTYLSVIPWEIALQQLNLLGSHDTPRYQAVLNNQEWKIKLAICILMTFPGIPCIYYGDEIGMGQDGDLRNNRTCMEWNPDRWDLNLRNFYKHLISFRKSSIALKIGGFQVLDQLDDIVVYQRDANGEWVIVIANRSSKTYHDFHLFVQHGGIPDHTEFKNVFTDDIYTVKNGELEFQSVLPGAIVLQGLAH